MVTLLRLVEEDRWETGERAALLNQHLVSVVVIRLTP